MFDRSRIFQNGFTEIHCGVLPTRYDHLVNRYRRWFFGTFVGLRLLDLADTWIKTRLVGDDLPMIPYVGLMTAWLVLCSDAACVRFRG